MATDFWAFYKKWNELIANRYLSPESAGRPVYLDVDDADLAEIRGQQGWKEENDQADFLSVVADTLTMSLELYDDLLEIHVRHAKSWLESPTEEPPPFLAVLAFFSYAAFRMTTTEDTAAHNYYVPLTELIFGEDWTEEQRSLVHKGYIKTAPNLWRRYGRWLEYTMHGYYGNPTTESLDRRVNIRYPLSQAILGTRDRENLKDCFAYARLRPGERLSGSEMEQVLSHWVPGSPLSSITKAIWARGGQHRSAMAQIAVEELISWDGMAEDATSDGRRTGNLILLVDKVETPFPNINFSVGMRGLDWAQTESFEVIEGSAKPYQKSSGETIDELALKRTEPGLWEVMQDLSIADLLGSLIRLENKDTGDLIRWTPRKFMVLDYDDGLRRWVDTGSTTIEKAMMILTHGSREDQLCSILAPALSRPLIKWDSTNMRGLPEGWVLLGDVWLETEVRIDDKEFTSLNSKTMSARIDLNGGLKIPSERIWLRSRLPTVSLAGHLGSGQTVDNRPVDVFELKLEESSLSAGFPTVTLEPIIDVPTVSFSLGDLDLPTGHYRITIEHQPQGGTKKALAAAHIGVCSADLPRSDRLHSQDAQQKTEDAWYPTHELVGCDGTWGVELPIDEPGNSDLPPPKLRSTSAEKEEDYFPSHLMKQFGTTTDCAHYTVLPPKEPGKNRWVYGNCKFCGAPVGGAPFKWGSNGSSTIVDAANLASLQVIRPQALEDLPVISSSSDVDHDGLFEACCYLTAGTTSEFVNLVSQASNETIYAAEVLQNLYSLGHLEIWREGPQEPIRWMVSPPTIVLTGPESAYLTGYRSDSFVDAVEAQVREQGGSLSRSSQPDGPIIITIAGLDPGKLNLVASHLLETFDQDVTLRWAPQLSPETSVPDRAALVDLLPEASPPNTSEIFEPKSLTWESTLNPDRAGLHRLPTRPVQHRINIDGRWRSTPYPLGKHLAGHMEGISLMAYDADSGTIKCSKGSQLPCPYDKIATMCTGKLPEFDLRSKSYLYSEVPATIASRIWGGLYG
jgi:hypothetical protein